MALGQVGLEFDYFYSLTPRVFNNILEGHVKNKQEDTELYLFGVRKLAYISLLPYKGKASTLKEQDIFSLPSEKELEDTENDDLEHVIKQVEQDKEFWEKIDKNKQNGCSTS